MAPFKLMHTLERKYKFSRIDDTTSLLTFCPIFDEEATGTPLSDHLNYYFAKTSIRHKLLPAIVAYFSDNTTTTKIPWNDLSLNSIIVSEDTVIINSCILVAKELTCSIEFIGRWNTISQHNHSSESTQTTRQSVNRMELR